ncbi:hypothetical protein [Helicobacter sp. 13S00477-4]|uniref:hypothetical protein n=1 Tax=Helicobacter sp. 13S00477-4 TaxID=1905759 RepID=UPI000BCD6CE9|nr:hypothetical protein [Helicobacter sp. 13S00477-4]PAF51658.1 hypothetical protein BKH44_05035 [Helicobacter sp. 13S00477-4]
MRQIIILMCLFAGMLYASGEVDYNKLDPSYYRYLKFYQKTSDKDIAELIDNIDQAHKKTGLFLGINIGYFGNDLVSTAQKDYLFAYGAKFGYQSFLPSFFEKLFLPNYVGRRLYIQYFATKSKEESLGKLNFSSITLNGDMLIDLPIWRGFGAGIIAGIGLGSMVRGYSASPELSAMLNTGFGVTLFGHNRLELELKIITNKSIDWMGTLFTLGYQYVF